MSATDDSRSKVSFPSGFGYSISLHFSASFVPWGVGVKHGVIVWQTNNTFQASSDSQ